MFTKKAVLVSSITAFSMAIMGTANAQNTRQLSVVHGSPEGHVISAQGVEPWMACVEEAVGKQVDFSYYPSGQISRTPELFRALESGIADLAPVPIGYVSDELPLSGVSMLPGLGSTSVQVVNAYSEALKNGALAREFAANNLVPLWVMAFPPYQIVSMGDRIDSVGDFQGKVLRSAGGAMSLALSELGASPAEIAISETYIALERGTADGTISAFSSIKPFNMHELMKSASTNGAFGTFSNVLSMPQDKFEALPADLQETFLDCGAQTEQAMARFLDEEAGELAKEFTELGIDIYQFTPESLEQINARLAQVQGDWVQRLSSRGLPAQEVLDSYKALLEDQ